MRFLFIEPFFGGSHQEFAKGLVAHCTHEIDLVSLPARFWKWRMRGAALYFYKEIKHIESYDGLITSDLMSLSDFSMLTGGNCPPALVYFHENQITYPLAPGEARDVQFGFTDITSGLAAQKLLFNSRTHLNEFFSALPGFIRMMPEYQPHWVTEVLRKKANVCSPGCRYSGQLYPLAPLDPGPPLIIWNHRWEFDKNPEAFFQALDAIDQQGIDFRLAVMGENFQIVPKPFLAARERFADKLVQYGYVRNRAEYLQWLGRGACVVSTADQENFGISVVEAIRHGCLPLLPSRLSYPEILPKIFHDDFLYQDQQDLVEKLCGVLKNCHQLQDKRQSLADAMAEHAWENRIGVYDEILIQLVGERPHQ